MIKHQRVQMRPVQVRAKFWVKESFSAGRAKSAIPAMTIAHCKVPSQPRYVLFVSMAKRISDEPS
jgi:hypothetical protein